MATSHTRARRVKGLIAGACGAALMLAGGTWALWYDADSVMGSTITAGNLDLAPAPGPAYYDISNITGYRYSTANGYSDYKTYGYRKDQTKDLGDYGCLPNAFDGVMGHTINLASGAEPKTWKAVPGDTVALVFPYVVALEGDNMVAELTVKSPLGTKRALILDALSDLSMEAYHASESGVVSKVVDYQDERTRSILGVVSGGASVTVKVYLQAGNEADGIDDPITLTAVEQALGYIKVLSDPISRTAVTGTTEADANFCVIVRGTFRPSVGDGSVDNPTPPVGADGTQDTNGDGNADNEGTRLYALQDLLEFPALDVALTQIRTSGKGNF